MAALVMSEPGLLEYHTDRKYDAIRIAEFFNDRGSYFLTFQQWTRNLDHDREAVVARFGDFNCRRFRFYLWGAAYEFLSGSLDCYA
jgi:cyclopropane-fatty-acyl-phospholipid synthase